MSDAWFQRKEKRKVTITHGQMIQKLCIDRKRTPVVCTKCEGNPWDVSTCVSGSRYR